MIILKKHILFINISLILVISIIFVSCSKDNEKSNNYYNDATENIKITVSDKINKTDLENERVYSRAYSQYNLKDEYEYYSCIVKIENNSMSNVANVYFSDIKNKNFRIDYKSEMFSPFFIESNSVGYVTCIISVKKGISNEELREIPYQLPQTIYLNFADDVNDISYKFYINKEYTVCSDDFSNNDIQIHTEPI